MVFFYLHFSIFQFSGEWVGVVWHDNICIPGASKLTKNVVEIFLCAQCAFLAILLTLLTMSRLCDSHCLAVFGGPANPYWIGGRFNKDCRSVLVGLPVVSSCFRIQSDCNCRSFHLACSWNTRQVQRKKALAVSGMKFLFVKNFYSLVVYLQAQNHTIFRIFMAWIIAMSLVCINFATEIVHK